MSKQPPKNLNEAIAPITDRIEEPSWEQNRPLCLGGAGVSLAVLLVVVQVGGRSPGVLHVVSTCLAAASIPIWLALWQLSDTNIFWGAKGLEHSKSLPWIFTSTGIAALGIFSLFLSILCLLAAFSKAAAITWVVMSIFLVFFVGWHAYLVRKYADS